MNQRQDAKRRFWARLDNHSAARCQRGTCLPQDHRDGEIPGDECHRNANWLLDSENPSIGRRGDLNTARNPLGFAREPPRESQRVVEFPQCFLDGFSRLVSQDLGDVLFMFTDEGVPFQEALCSDSRVNFAISLEGLMGCFHGIIDVFSCVVRR